MRKLLSNMIKKEDLVKGRWYAGSGRNANVGLWDGKVFITVGYKFGHDTTYHEGYWEAESGCFQPIEEIKCDY